MTGVSMTGVSITGGSVVVVFQITIDAITISREIAPAIPNHFLSWLFSGVFGEFLLDLVDNSKSSTLAFWYMFVI